MAYRTAEQKDVAEDLRKQYGVEDRMQIEDTEEPYGLLQMTWWLNGPDMQPTRTLLIRPDGQRLTWRTL